MSDRVPASLAYLLIYNPTLPLPPNASRDDEDAQEEAHILFYSSRERVASRDRMLRQVGLAKALVNFSEIFTPGQGCDTVHSQGKRMISVSPEPDFWMHACADLAKTPKPSKDKGKVAKGQDPPAPTYYFHEDSLHDLALRNHMLKGYEEFKLLHGTFTSILKEHGSESLQTHQERFFTPWAWRWDLESAHDFGKHLGLPLHPLNATLAPLVSSFFQDVPSSTTPLLLCPPYIIDPSHPSAAAYPPSLLAHLLSLAPPPSRPTPRRNLSKRLDQTKGGRTTARNGTGDTATASSTFGFLNAAGTGMGDVINVKKWSWPGVLTFGKIGPTAQNRQTQSADSGGSGSQIKFEELDKSRNDLPPDDSATPKVDEQERNAPAAQDIPVNVEAAVDQRALDDAMITSSPPPPPQPPQSNVSQPAVEPNVTAEVEIRQQVGNDADISPTIRSQLLGSRIPNASPPLAPSQLDDSVIPTGHPFSVQNIFLSEPLEPLVVQRRSILHVSRFRFIFALLVDVGSLADEIEEQLRVVGDKLPDFLENVRRAIDARDSESEASATTNGNNRTRHIICSPPSIVPSSAGFPSTSSQNFENQELLARDTATIEVFSRSMNPQHWFVAKRGLGFSKTGEKLQGEVYLEAGNKEASLVDADNELVGAVRRWAHGED